MMARFECNLSSFKKQHKNKNIKTTVVKVGPLWKKDSGSAHATIWKTSLRIVMKEHAVNQVLHCLLTVSTLCL